ncbi:substrate-binding domain-containing protein [Sphingomonas baiyangensis]|uniref:substrate-binding domain-containing protein n=1 Tax=Sphingomonas baiyangensis TaxID=2572576 RepID=UPI001469CC2C|nr:substrate-binding domain-containing protein [Sphingomonas baiyangensis]
MPKIVAVTHDLLGDPFWEPFVAGIATGRAETGCEVIHLRPETYSLMGLLDLTQQALAMKPDGLVTTLPQPEKQQPVLAQAIAEGLPVGVLNTFDRRPAEQRLASLFRVGADDYRGGRMAAGRLLGAGHRGPALAIDHYRVRNTCHAARIGGFADAMAASGVTTQVVAVDTLNSHAPSDIAQAIAKHRPDSVLTLGPPGLALLAAACDYGMPPANVTFDVTPESIAACATGQTMATIDCQPFLQGYLGVTLMIQFLRQGVVPVADILTGPRFAAF